MIILGIIGFAVVLYLLYLLVLIINSYTQQKYRYTFFNKTNLWTSTAAYIILWIGYNWYSNALHHDGDVLNGIILMTVGAGLFIYVVHANIKNTDYVIGTLLSVVQMVMYVGLAIIQVIVFIVFILGALSLYRGCYFNDCY